MAVKHGFGEAQVRIDREQGTSRWLLILMQPWFLLYRLINKIPPIHHDRKLLLGRLLFMKFSKANDEKSYNFV